ncbi:hypothetical protein [Ferroacidibacillus organovorans]|uniref:Uncharacterized protein n=1 Tax=Ferroacidibacillus organovorans TaxID=1765683 RepID=A0A1V4ESL0_9BACL|nr:hypothetical protein [Ferroacidibacillus organovorans]OPG15830.1 hypothetical protein B2M26_09460 [Ferroacidibacillus organovorans]
MKSPFVKTMILSLAILWLTGSGLITLAHRINTSLSASANPDAEARFVAQIVAHTLPMRTATTVLYLNGKDGGDNYYRVAYLLYPITFVPYWSWHRPNAGGDVWNAKAFSTRAGIASIIRRHRVRYIIALHHPKFLSLLGIKPSASKGLLILFQVKNPQSLRANARFSSSFHVIKQVSLR